jgi:P5-type ATPase cation transporter
MGQSDSLPSKLNMGEKDELEARGYRSHGWKWALTLALIVLTFGLFGVILVWRKDIKMALFYQECPLHEATVILLKVINDSWSTRPVHAPGPHGNGTVHRVHPFI